MLKVTSEPNNYQSLPHIKINHQDELNSSAIDPAIAALNFESVAGEDILEWLIEHQVAQLGGHAQQYATRDFKRLRDRMEPVAMAGGWRFRGVDPLNNWARMDWGCFKPDQPRPRWKQDKTSSVWSIKGVIKYENQHGVTAGLFVPQITWKAGAKIASKHGHRESYKQRAIEAGLPGFGADSMPPGLDRGFWQWWTSLPVETAPIAITEGAKKTAALASHGYAAVGIAGKDQWNTPGTKDLMPGLAFLAKEGREFFIALDQDTKAKTRHDVSVSVLNLSAALRRKKCRTQVIPWNPALGKGVDDLIVAYGPEAFDAAYGHAVSPEVLSVQLRSELGFDPDWVAPEGTKFLTDAGIVEAIPQDVKFVGIKSGKGTGKTEAISRVVEQGRERGQRTLMIVHRIQLSKVIGDRTNILSVYEVVNEKGEAKHHKLAEVMANGMSLCVHSCHPGSQAQFRAADWLDAIVVMDECTQMFWDVLNTSTLKGTRVPILKELQTLLTGVLSPETEGRLFLLDADLDYITIDGVRNIAGQPNLKPWIGISNYQEGGYNCHIHSKREQWLLQAEQDLSDGKKLLVMTDSQKRKGRFSSTAIKKRWEKKFPGLRVLRVDSETLELKDHPAFGCIKNANEVFSQYDVVICSPSVETGISLDLKGHFDKVYGCFQGVLSENSVRQSLARLREPVDRVIYAATRGLGFVAGGDTYWKAVRETTEKKAEAIVKHLVKVTIDHLGVCLSPALDMWAKYAARLNAGMALYRETIIAQLRAEGQTVTEEDDPEQDIKEAIAKVKADQKEDQHDDLVAHGEAVNKAEDISNEELEKREESRKPQSKAQTLETERKKLSKKYGVEPTLDLFMLDQDGWEPKLKLHYYLTVGREKLKDREKETLSQQIEASNGNGLWLPDVAKVSIGLKVGTLEYLQVLQLLELAGTDKVIHQDHPLVIEIFEKASSSAKSRVAVHKALSLKITSQTRPISFIRDLLGKIGFGLEKGKKITSQGKQVHSYLIKQVDTKTFNLESKDEPVIHEYSYSRETVFEHWLAQDTAATDAVKTEMLKTAETTEQQEAAPVVVKNLVGISGNSISIPSPNAYHSPLIKRQAGAAQNSPSELTQVEEVCLSILETCDHWGQYLSVQTQIGAQRVGQLWGMLTGQQQRSIRDMEPQGGML